MGRVLTSCETLCEWPRPPRHSMRLSTRYGRCRPGTTARAARTTRRSHESRAHAAANHMLLEYTARARAVTLYTSRAASVLFDRQSGVIHETWVAFVSDQDTWCGRLYVDARGFGGDGGGSRRTHRTGVRARAQHVGPVRRRWRRVEGHAITVYHTRPKCEMISHIDGRWAPRAVLVYGGRCPHSKNAEHTQR